MTTTKGLPSKVADSNRFANNSSGQSIRDFILPLIGLLASRCCDWFIQISKSFWTDTELSQQKKEEEEEEPKKSKKLLIKR